MSRNYDRFRQRVTEYLQSGDHRRAERLLATASLRAPDDSAILTRYADTLYQAGRIAQARGVYRQALARNKTEFQTWYGCRMAEFSLGGYARAIDCLRQASALEPRDADARSSLARECGNPGLAQAMGAFSGETGAT